MAKAPPDPVHIIHNPSGPVTALASLKRNENSPSTLVSGSDNGVITIWTLDVGLVLYTRQHTSCKKKVF